MYYLTTLQRLSADARIDVIIWFWYEFGDKKNEIKKKETCFIEQQPKTVQTIVIGLESDYFMNTIKKQSQFAYTINKHSYPVNENRSVFFKIRQRK